MEYQLIKPTILIDTDNLTLVEQVFANRGIYPQDINHYLNTTDADIFSPETIANIKDGIALLVKHISLNSKVFLQCDSDADGFTSAAVFLNYLHRLFPAFVENNITYRIHNGKEHGVIVETVPRDTKLVIIPDAGSNQLEEDSRLHDLGMDILVIDHHEADDVSPYACVINNQLCNYPNKTLSGVGMVWKFCSLIDEYMNTSYANDYLDLVAVGLIGDMMDVRNYETRHIIAQGLSHITNPYIELMMNRNEYSIQGELDPFKVAFYIVPYINATIRAGSVEEKILLFESMLDYRSYELIPSTKRGCKGQMETRVEQACRNCTNIKNHQTKDQNNAVEIIQQLIEKNELLKNKILLIKIPKDLVVNKNLTGLIANKLMSEYQKPVLLLSETYDENGDLIWSGSGRAPSGMKIENFREWLLDTGLMKLAQGHASAFGAAIADVNIEKFINYTNEALKDFDFSPCYKVDAIFNANEIAFKEADILKLAEYNSVWGQGLTEAVIAIENVKLTSETFTLMSPEKSPTLKISPTNSNVSYIRFGSSKEEYEKLYPDLGCVSLNIVGTCQRNIWNGIVTPQIIVKSYEVVNKTQYYF